MSSGLHRLPLEKPIYEIEDRISQLEAAPVGGQQQEELRRLKRELVDIQKQVFGSLDPWQTVEVARLVAWIGLRDHPKVRNRGRYSAYCCCCGWPSQQERREICRSAR
jgi:hypothetical protein